MNSNGHFPFKFKFEITLKQMLLMHPKTCLNKWMKWKPMGHGWLDQMEQWNLNFNDILNQGMNIDTQMKHETMNWKCTNETMKIMNEIGLGSNGL